MQARYYAPELRRFISADTIVPEPGNPQAFNRYAYTYQNPINFTDPAGHLTEDEIDKYFGYSAEDFAALRELMLEAGWQDFLVNWLLDPETHFGDVFTYENTSGEVGHAMLVLFETKSAGSGVYKGGFYGLDGLRRGEQVSRSSIGSLDETTFTANELESRFAERFDELPQKTGTDGRNYYYTVNYTALGSDWKGYAGLTVSAVGVTATAAACLSNPVGWGMCGTGAAAVGAGATFVGGVLTGFELPDPVQYPIIQLPRQYQQFYGDPPNIWGWLPPRGFH